jgi:hypothetical protein
MRHTEEFPIYRKKITLEKDRNELAQEEKDALDRLEAASAIFRAARSI